MPKFTIEQQFSCYVLVKPLVLLYLVLIEKENHLKFLKDNLKFFLLEENGGNFKHSKHRIFCLVLRSVKLYYITYGTWIVKTWMNTINQNQVQQHHHYQSSKGNKGRKIKTYQWPSMANRKWTFAIRLSAWVSTVLFSSVLYCVRIVLEFSKHKETSHITHK